MVVEWKELTMGELLEADGLSAVLKHCAEKEINPIMKQAEDASNKGVNVFVICLPHHYGTALPHCCDMGTNKFLCF
jgi:hypothetical protein